MNDLLLGFLVFLAYFVTDALYAAYTIQITRKNAFNAATIGAAMHVLIAFGVVNLTRSYWFVLPIVAGSWLGTYVWMVIDKCKNS